MCLPEIWIQNSVSIAKKKSLRSTDTAETRLLLKK